MLYMHVLELNAGCMHHTSEHEQINHYLGLSRLWTLCTLYTYTQTMFVARLLKDCMLFFLDVEKLQAGLKLAYFVPPQKQV